jgi:hypothetical protein
MMATFSTAPAQHLAVEVADSAPAVDYHHQASQRSAVIEVIAEQFPPVLAHLV